MQKIYTIPPEVEEECQDMMREYLLENNSDEEYIRSQIDYIFSMDSGSMERFMYVDQYLDSSHKDRLLISGSAVGNEILQAKEVGFHKVTGTEVLQVYKDICEIRLQRVKDVRVDIYNGKELNYPDNSFSCVMSGHIIEHTMAPLQYIKEHLRVLREGGLFFLEFPDRFHDVELHTGTKSYEALPLWRRYLILKMLSSSLNRNKIERQKYFLVLKTLVPVSIGDIQNWSLEAGYLVEIVDSRIPHPGFTRVILRKKQE